MNDYFSNVIVARFIGEDGFMGLVHDKVYIIKLISGYNKGKCCLWVFFRGGSCPYYSFEALTNNWSLFHA